RRWSAPPCSTTRLLGSTGSTPSRGGTGAGRSRRCLDRGRRGFRSGGGGGAGGRRASPALFPTRGVGWRPGRGGQERRGGGRGWRCRERRFRRLGLYAAYAPIAWAETEIRRMFEKK